MKYYTTKYLGQGVVEVEAEPGDNPAYVYSDQKLRVQYIVGVTAFPMRKEAVARLEKDRIRKIASHEKAIAKLRKMVF